VTTSVSATTVPPAEPAEDFLGADEVSEVEPEGAAELIVEGVRTGIHEDYDRIVFDLSGEGTVGWRVEFVEDPRLDGSGAPVDLAGAHVLVVLMRGMAQPGADSTAYETGQLLVPGTGLTSVTEVLRTVPFEGQLAAFVGTRERVPYRVFELSDPPRLVVDVQVP
jgi:hypothetical protein